MTIAVVKSGSFTGVTYEDRELTQSIYDEHTGQGESLVYLDSAISNSGTDAVPIYRSPTAGETASTIGTGDLPSTFSVNEDAKLAGVETGATGDQNAAEVRALVDSATDSNVFTDADHSKLDGIEAGATGDMTGAEIKVAYEAEVDTNAYNDADKAKVDFISVTGAVDLDNVVLQAEKGAANGIPTLDGSGQIPASQLPISAMEFKGFFDANLGSPALVDGTGDDGDVYYVSDAGTYDFGSGAYPLEVGDQLIYSGAQWLPVYGNTQLDAASVKTLYESNADTNNFDDAAVTKLAGIEAGAEVNHTGAEIKSLYEGEADTNAFTDTEKSKLASLSNNPAGDYQRIIANPTVTSATTIPTFAAGNTVSYQVQSSDPQSLFKIIDDDGTGITINAETGTMFGGSGASAGSYTLVVVTASVFGQSANTNLSLTIS